MVGKWKSGYRRVFAFILMLTMVATSFDISLLSGAMAVSAAQHTTATLKEGNYAKWIDRVEKPRLDDGFDYMTDVYANLETGTSLTGTGWTRQESLIKRSTKLRDNGAYYGEHLFHYPTATAMDNDDVQAVYRNLRIVYDAFLMDHPEVFWLTNEPQFRSVYDAAAKRQTFYLVLAYPTSNPYDIRKTGYRSDEAITNAISAMNGAVSNISGDGTVVAKIRRFYEFLINNNEANASASPSEIEKEGVSALTKVAGSTPDSAAYARAMKILCDNAGIGCEIVSDTSGKMWNKIYISENDAWYAVDAYAADLAAQASGGAISDDYLLVGSDTAVSGQNTFGADHDGANIGSVSGFGFKNGEEVSATRYILNPQYINGITLMAPTKGRGTQGSPYQIANERQLFWYAAYVNDMLDSRETNQVAYAELSDNIVMTADWIPIGMDDAHMFRGVFDGKLHTITGLKVGDTSSSYTGGNYAYGGLFGTVSGTIKNLHLTGASFTGTGGSRGLISGKLAGGTIEYCYTDNSALSSGTGGLAGDAGSGTISYSFTTCGALAVNTGTVTMAFYQTSSSGGDEGPAQTADEFASGKVAYLLNGKTSKEDSVWHQNLEIGARDAYPVFDVNHGRIYYDGSTQSYSNRLYPVVTFENTEYYYNGDYRLKPVLPDNPAPEGNYRLIYGYASYTTDWVGNDESKYEEIGWNTISGEYTSATLKPGHYYMRVRFEGATNYTDKIFYTKIWVRQREVADLTVELAQLKSGDLVVTSDELKANGNQIQYTGNTVQYEVSVTDGGVTLTEGTDYTLSCSGDLVNANNTPVTITVTGQGSYTGSKSITFRIVKKTATLDVLYNTNYTYNGNPIPDLDRDNIRHTNSDSNWSCGHKWYDSEGTALSGAPTNAGTYKLVVTLNESTNFAEITKELEVTIAKRAPSADDVVVKSLPSGVIYDGQAHTAEVETAAGVQGFGTITVKYKRQNAQTYVPNDQPVDAGTYVVWVAVSGGDNYSDTAFSTNQTFTIERRELTEDMLMLVPAEGATDSNGRYYYKGPDVAIRPGIKSQYGYLNDTSDYTVHYVNNLQIGEASVSITGQGNFTGVITKTFQIVAKTVGGTPYDIIGVSPPNQGELWYKGTVKIQPRPAGDYTIHERDGKYRGDGDRELVIDEEGVVIVNFYLKDAYGNYVYPDSYDMWTLNFRIDAKGPDLSEKGIVIHDTSYTTLRPTATFGAIDTEAVWVDIYAADQWSGLKNIYYYVQRVTGDDNSVRTLSKDDLDALASSFQILTAPDSGDANSTDNKKYNAGFTMNTDGRFIVYAYAEDNFGNRSDYICSNGIIIDRTPPVINYILSPTRAQGTLSDIEATIRFHASEAGTYYYTVLKAEDVANGTVAEPTVEDLIENGQSLGSGDMVSGLQNSAGVQNRFQLTGLEAMTEYIVYIAAVDKAGNYTAVVNGDGTRTGVVKSEKFKTCKKIARFDDGQKPTLTGIYGTAVKDMTLNGPESNNDVAGAWTKVDEWANETTGDTHAWHVGQSYYYVEVTGGGEQEIDYTDYADYDAVYVENTDTDGDGNNDAYKDDDTGITVKKIDLIYEVQFVPEDTETCEILTVQVTPEISPRPIAVTIDDAERIYREEDPDFTFSYDENEIIGTDKNTIGEWIVRRTDAVTNSDVGTYPIHGECINPDYSVEFTEGTLTIHKAQSSITVDKDLYEKTFGDDAFTFEGITMVGQAALVYSIQSSGTYKPGQTELADSGAVVTINGNGEVRIVGAGEAVVRIQLPESKNYYQSNPVDITIKVAKHEAVDTAVDKKYVYAAGSKDTLVELDITKLIPADMGETLYRVAGTLDEDDILAVLEEGETLLDESVGGIVSPEEPNGPVKARVSEKGRLTYQVNRMEESEIGKTAEIKLSVDTVNYESTTVVIRILIIDKIEVMNLVGDETTVRVLDESQLTYGILLGDVALNTDTAVFVESGENGNKDIPVTGTLEWKEPDTILAVSLFTMGSWIFTPDDTETYKVLEGILGFTVERAVPDVTVPTASPSQLTYNPVTTLNEFMINGTNGAWTVGGNPVTVAGTWSWQAADTTPTVDVATYTAVFTPEDDANYAPATAEVEITIGKAVPYIAEYPVTAELTYGQTLEDAVFSGGSVQYSENTSVNGYNTPVDGTFEWKEKELMPEVIDSAENNGTRYVAVFIPTDNVNYEERSFPMTVTVVPAEQPSSTPTFTRLDISFDSELEYISEIASQLPDDWTWDENEDWALQSGKEYYLTAIYAGADAGRGNYKLESVKITVKRGDCGHSRTEIRNKREVSCLVNGYTGDTYCADCGDLMEKGAVIDAKGHTWNAGKIVVEATCTEDGTVRYTCLVCGEEEDRHDRADVYATGHDWNNDLTTIDPTCTEAGSTSIRCKKCDAIQEGTYEEIPALDHTGGSATCVAAAVCERCGESYGEPDPHNHPETEIRNVHEATCSEAGNTGDLYCLACGNLVLAGDTIEKPEHTWTNHMVTTMPTCVDTGIETSVCASCGEVKEEEIPATGVHRWNTKYTVDVAATTKKEGVQSIHCSVCNTIKEGSEVAIPVLPPTKGSKIKAANGDQYVVTKAATDKAQGTLEFKKAGNTNATKFVIQGTVTIGRFSYKITSVANNAFKGNTKLKTVTIGNNVTTIGNNAFANCTKLTTVTIGSKVTSIGTKAFLKCTALKKITIPAKVKTIGKQAFSGCKKLSGITIKTTNLKSSSVGNKAFSGIAAKAVIKVPKKKLASYRTILKAKGVGANATIRS